MHQHISVCSIRTKSPSSNRQQTKLERLDVTVLCNAQTLLFPRMKQNIIVSRNNIFRVHLPCASEVASEVWKTTYTRFLEENTCVCRS